MREKNQSDLVLKHYYFFIPYTFNTAFWHFLFWTKNTYNPSQTDGLKYILLLQHGPGSPDMNFHIISIKLCQDISSQYSVILHRARKEKEKKEREA